MKKFVLIASLLASSAAFAQQAPVGGPVPPQSTVAQPGPANQLRGPGPDRGWHKGMREDLRKFNDEHFAAHKKAIAARLQAHLACVNSAKNPAELHGCRPQRQASPGELRAEDMRPPRPPLHCHGDAGCQGPRGSEGEWQGPRGPQGGAAGNAADRLIR